MPELRLPFDGPEFTGIRGCIGGEFAVEMGVVY